MQNLLRSRETSEQEALPGNTPRNRLRASALINLLAEYNATESSHNLKDLGDKYNVDEAMLTRLGRLVNTPKYGPEVVEKTGTGEGQERVTRTVSVMVFCVSERVVERYFSQGNVVKHGRARSSCFMTLVYCHLLSKSHIWLLLLLTLVVYNPPIQTPLRSDPLQTCHGFYLRGITDEKRTGIRRILWHQRFPLPWPRLGCPS